MGSSTEADEPEIHRGESRGLLDSMEGGHVRSLTIKNVDSTRNTRISRERNGETLGVGKRKKIMPNPLRGKVNDHRNCA